MGVRVGAGCRVPGVRVGRSKINLPCPAPGTRHLIPIFAAIALMLVVGCGQQPADEQTSAPEITVAAAANLTDAFAEVATQFTARTGVRVVYSFGGTADLTRQIENGGPFDLFAAADVAHVDELNRKGLIIPESRALYARGRLVLWIPPGSQARIDRIEDVANTDVKIIAVAKPDLAPYGQAALEALMALNLWRAVEPKVVYGTNVSQARQFATSGNADAAFIPPALVKKGEGRIIEVDQRLHRPIDQALAIIKASARPDLARRFADFVLSAEGQAILEQYGYIKPPAE